MANSDPFGGEEEPELDISPLIDVAFLLLIYFLVTTTLQKSEADLSLVLPGVAQEDSREVKIDQMLVKVDQAGVVYVNEEVADTDPENRALPNLTDRLSRYAAAAEVANTETQVIIDCDQEAVGQRFIDVLNVCAKAKIKNVSLAN
ncbi:MAG: biopolymer transporter ExbD [Verrucomicrobiales bacterium]|jgi:biopolymer transport protein ExbD|nr:biopolymer transporter ExbD [Verrucomicrobiales bacterium]|tara:strand:+ start:12171 stop:12608 length:438 start_codon:yes stop_codon:yes gene_type:complete